MTNFKLKSIATLITVSILTSCSNNSTNNSSNSSFSTNRNSTSTSSNNSISTVKEKAPYELMNIVFVGNPEISKIKPMLEAVLENYNYQKTDDNRLKVANVLLALRKNSAIGVTEMEILKHIYQNGSNQIPLTEQAALSASILEFSK